MFPHKSGGVAIYANEGWRKYTTLVGPIATFGYWIGWSVVLSYLGLFTGYIIRTAWFPGEPSGTYALGRTCADPCPDYFSTGPLHIGLDHVIAIGLILAVWLFNVRGVRVAVTFGYLAGALLMIPLFVFMILPFLNGDFDSSNLTWGALDGTVGTGPDEVTLSTWKVVRLSIVWLWLMAGLVCVGGGHMCHVCPRVRGHRARHEARAPLRLHLHALRLHPPSHRSDR